MKEIKEDLIKMLMNDKEGEKLLKDAVNVFDKDKLNSDCEIHITKKDFDIHTNIEGRVLTVLIVLKTVMDKLKKDLNISDEDFTKILKSIKTIGGEHND